MTHKEIKERANHYLSLETQGHFRQEIQKLLDQDNWEELSDRFWRNMDFGTGGLRGLMGGGTNRINPYVIRQATEGLAQYIEKNVPQEQWSVVLSYDSRHYAALFAEEAACVLASHNIKSRLFSAVRPTPELSYAVRQWGACAGIMVTASHNPATYNGYKVYWADGAQILPPHDEGIINEFLKVSGKIEAMDREEAERSQLIVPLDEETDKSYRRMVVAQSLRPELFTKKEPPFNVVYSALHGVGSETMQAVFHTLGLPLIMVPEQSAPDGDFPTLNSPNPETPESFALAIALAKKKNADLILTSDPDADRLGIAVPDGKEWIFITGNQLGALLLDYIIRTRKEQQSLPENPAFINTIVSSEFQNRVAESYAIDSFRVLTGFKYIGEKIRHFQENQSHRYLFGCEESYGFLIGDSVRDKDAISAASMTAELCLWNRQRGLTLMDHLKELWKQHGYWQEMLVSHNFEGQSGQEKIKNLMSLLRNHPPEEIAGKKRQVLRDYREGTSFHTLEKRKKKDIMLPSSNVLQFVLDDASLVTIRPSGTEPKIKFYASCCSEKGSNLASAQSRVRKSLQDIKQWVNKTLEGLND